jgi:predicted nucleic acid-binding Zn ribbon protein
MDGRRIVCGVDDDLLQDRTEDSLLECDRCAKAIPKTFEIVAQGKQMFALFGCNGREDG